LPFKVLGRQVGFIAEEVAGVFPELVRYKDGEPEGVQYERLPVYLFQIAKEQQLEIENLKLRLDGGGTSGGSESSGSSSGGSSNSSSGSSGNLDFNEILKWIKDKVVEVKELIADKISAKTARFEKIEMKDKATGGIYCTWIENGEWVKTEGECQ